MQSEICYHVLMGLCLNLNEVIKMIEIFENESNCCLDIIWYCCPVRIGVDIIQPIEYSMFMDMVETLREQYSGTLVRIFQKLVY